MSQDTIYWRSFEELTNHPEFIKDSLREFNIPSPTELEQAQAPDRRDFLKKVGFGLSAAALASCEAPVRKVIPFLANPDNVDYSNANWYASSYMLDGEYCAILVKTKAGRPIKIEGNKLSSVTRGGTSVRVQASVLGLYDNSRYVKPQIDKKNATWQQVDEALAAAVKTGKRTVLVTPSMPSPSFEALVARMQAAIPGFEHVVYDALPASGIIKANKESFGQAVVPSYDFSKANTVVSFDADFLGTWLSPVEFSRAWARTRKLGPNNKRISKLFVVEPLMSLTGANADQRIMAKGSALGSHVAALYNAVMARTGGSARAVVAGVDQKAIDKMADDLVANRGRSVVVAGSNDPAQQTLVNGINFALGNYGTTINLNTPVRTKQGTEEGIAGVLAGLENGSIGTVLFYNTDPVYTHPQGAALKAALKNATGVSLDSAPTDTADACKIVAAAHHYLESWNDFEPKTGFFSLQQPAISPLFETRQAEDTLLKLAGVGETYYDFVRATWRSRVFPQQTEYKGFNQFWNYALHDGIFEVGRPSLRGKDFAPNGTGDADERYEYLSLSGTAPAAFAGNVGSAMSAVTGQAAGQGLELVLYPLMGMMAGVQGNNPMLLEFPDPISRVTWENYVTLAPTKAVELGVSLAEGRTSLVKLKVGGKELTMPAIVQPGQEKNTIGLAVGYGRTVVGEAGKGVGQNAFPFVNLSGGFQSYVVSGVSVENTKEEYMLGHVQTSHTNAGRPVIQEATLAEYQKNPTAGREFPMITTPDGKMKPTDLSLWKTEVNKRPNHAWGMVIDLNSCIGCGACVVGCNVENNVAVVGKQEVVNRREMHWLRIDRYYSSTKTREENATNEELETAAENPRVTFQPMMCQQCNNAPCETVCPVLATTHSTEGLNQMTYNRCIGTRYCANNCPYKVRRFNWFSYPQNKENFPTNPANDPLTRMVLNPDVTVRARGVMEKCTFCIQRIQDGKLTAKKDGRRPVDGEIVTACAQACPTEAIIFGDMNDPNSRVQLAIKEQYSERAFRVLEEYNTRPNVSYLTKIRNA